MMVNGQRMTCTLDGMSVGCGMAMNALNNGSAVQCSNNDCGPRTTVNSSGQTVLTSPFIAYADGRSGFNVPTWGSTTVNVVGEPRGPDNWTIIGSTFHQTSSSSVWWGYFDFLKPTSDSVEVVFGDKEKARDGLKRLISLGECGAKLKGLLAALGSTADVRASDILGVFDDVRGGLLLNTDERSYSSAHKELTGGRDVAQGVGGGGGAAVAVSEAGNTANGIFMLVGVQTYRYARNPNSSHITITPQDVRGRSDTIQTLMFRLVHELIHAAGKSRTFSHAEVAKAARSVDPELSDPTLYNRTGNNGEEEMNEFIKKHCTSLISASR